MPRKKTEEVTQEAKPEVAKEEATKTWEFEQGGFTWRKTYNAKGDVTKTEKL